MVRRYKLTRKIRKTRRNIARHRRPLKSIIGKMIRKQQEKKYHQRQRYEYAVGSVGAALVDNLTLVPQGDTDLTRDGDKLMMKTLRLDYMIAADTASAYPYVSRVMLVQVPEDSSGYVPSPATLLQNIGSAAEAIISPYDHDNRYKHRVLYDKTHLISPGIISVGSSAPADRRIVKRSVRITPPKKWLQFSGGGTTSKNHIYLLHFNYTQGGHTTFPYLTYNSKLNFTDS